MSICGLTYSQKEKLNYLIMLAFYFLFVRTIFILAIITYSINSKMFAPSSNIKLNFDIATHRIKGT